MDLHFVYMIMFFFGRATCPKQMGGPAHAHRKLMKVEHQCQELFRAFSRSPESSVPREERNHWNSALELLQISLWLRRADGPSHNAVARTAARSRQWQWSSLAQGDDAGKKMAE